ncbi:hypothetical protein MNB_SUP05-7-51 [hydrothermal vent metagenome]|uniref:Uncharacterized protein n=1 Tax=hydrothermal vent metagenome TaxID=652676 RepID=A0A1W1DRF7_9ZZZZ
MFDKSIKFFSISGLSANKTVVGKQPGLPINCAPLICSRLISESPYTDDASRSSWKFSKPYHCAYSFLSRKRKSGPKSITLMPLLIKVPAVSIATPCGVAKKITSHLSKTTSSGAVKAKSVCPAKDGKNSPTSCPASERELIAITSTCAWLCNSRRSSTPV